jgi:glutathione synthase/RimK-type ligase-like ATP-grasp enzyme
MNGLPDDMLVQLSVNGRDRTTSFNVPGTACFLPHLAPDVRKRLPTAMFGPTIQIKPDPGARGRPLVNYIADADTSPVALRMLCGILDELRSGCFNHPAAVLDTGRDRVAAKLAGIPGLHVPRTIRRRIAEPAELVAALEAEGITYPVIVRIAGIHGGKTTVRIDRADDVASALRGIPWGGRDVYATEYVPYADADGLHRKLRVVVVGERVFLRHMVIAGDWHVHAQDRDERMAAEEQARLAGFDDVLLPRIAPAVRAVADALQLDYFGIDCSLRPDGRLLLFEANAAMNILANTKPSPNYWDAPIERIRDALSALLFEPARWRFPTWRAPA